MIDNSEDPKFVTMQKGDRIYVHVLHDDLAGEEICLPGVRITSAVCFDNSEEGLEFRNKEDAGYIRLPSKLDSLDEVLVLEGDFDKENVRTIN